MKTIATALLASTLLTGLVGPAFAQGADGPPSIPGADRRYQVLVDNSPWFRGARVQEECAPITDAALRKSCIDSFGRAPRALPTGFVPPPPVPGTQAVKMFGR